MLLVGWAANVHAARLKFGTLRREVGNPQPGLPCARRIGGRGWLKRQTGGAGVELCPFGCLELEFQADRVAQKATAAERSETFPTMYFSSIAMILIPLGKFSLARQVTGDSFW